MTFKQLANAPAFPSEHHGTSGITLLEYLVANQAAAIRSRDAIMSYEMLAKLSLEDAKAIIEELKNHYERLK